MRVCMKQKRLFFIRCSIAVIRRIVGETKERKGSEALVEIIGAMEQDQNLPWVCERQVPTKCVCVTMRSERDANESWAVGPGMCQFVNSKIVLHASFSLTILYSLISVRQSERSSALCTRCFGQRPATTSIPLHTLTVPFNFTSLR